MPTATYTVADAKTDPVAITFKWRTLLPTDVAAATLADLGGALQSGTGSIAANASPRQAQFTITTTPNTTVTGDRSFDVEIYDVTPAGATLTVSKVRTKIVEDDSAGTGPTIVYGPTSTTDTTARQTNSRLHKVTSVWRADRLYTLRIAVTGNSYLEMKSDSGVAVNFRLYVDGAQVGSTINMNGISAPPADGAEISFERRVVDGVYQGFATYGTHTQPIFIGGDLTGTQAQGLIWYGGAELMTITAL